MNKIFDNIQIGKLDIRNRLVRSATWENMATETGHMTEKLYNIYEELADSEIGLIITGYANVVKEEKPNPGMMGIYEDSFIEEYKVLTDLVHQKGSKIVMQIAYGGTKTTYNVGERIIFAPSEVAELGTNTLGKEMTLEEIKEMVVAFGQAARRVRESGFDGVELHAAHTYLINQFLSPYYNRRTDEYGGNLENRMKFLVEVCQEMKKQTAEDYPLIVKLTATEFIENGQTFEDTKIIAKKLEEIGVTAIELSGNIHGKASKMSGEVFDGYEIKKEGYFTEYAKVISEEINIPVITVGGFREPGQIEELLNESKIEAIAISRPLICEPNLAKRWAEGDIRKAKCVSCSRCRTSEGNYCTVFK